MNGVVMICQKHRNFHKKFTDQWENYIEYITKMCYNPISKMEDERMFDYHVHTNCSHDGSYAPVEQLEAAVRCGVTELCFTDHVDFDNPAMAQLMPPADLGKLKNKLEGITPIYKGVRVKIGAEVGLGNLASSAKAWEYIKPHDLDFIIGSVHVVKGFDVYFPEYFIGKTKQSAYIGYLETILNCIKHCDFMCVLGHYDFVTKYAPFSDRRMSLSISKELFEAIFKSLIERGKGIEINTSAWRDEPAWGNDVLKMYAELGGEFVTTGSDAHRPSAVARRLDEAEKMAVCAGIKYLATYDALVPKLHPIYQ